MSDIILVVVGLLLLINWQSINDRIELAEKTLTVIEQTCGKPNG